MNSNLSADSMNCIISSLRKHSGVAVSGKVTSDGSLVEKGVIAFVPESPGKRVTRIIG